MTQISPQPIVLKDVLLQIGADNFEKQVSQATLTPSASAQTWQGLSPTAMYADIPFATWQLELNFAQDHETAGSLSSYLLANEGLTVSGVLKPRAGFGPSYQVTLILTPGAIGGQVNAWAESKVTLPVRGKPTPVTTASVPVAALSSPATGGVAGGNAVAISGAGFTGVTGAAGVKFGTSNATSYTVISDTLIIAVAPAQAAGSKPITVTNGAGASTILAPYTYV
ncbi:IPT/TIG domain-containing protein [Glaciibacter flavus]|uniref:IPT/TIG domain-containing protein n=1 Tax=Orlajensenia flava TaxID=2565934 RepID=UPI003B0048DD